MALCLNLHPSEPGASKSGLRDPAARKRKLRSPAAGGSCAEGLGPLQSAACGLTLQRFGPERRRWTHRLTVKETGVLAFLWRKESRSLGLREGQPDP